MVYAKTTTGARVHAEATSSGEVCLFVETGLADPANIQCVFDEHNVQELIRSLSHALNS